MGILSWFQNLIRAKQASAPAQEAEAPPKRRRTMYDRGYDAEARARLKAERGVTRRPLGGTEGT